MYCIFRAHSYIFMMECSEVRSDVQYRGSKRGNSNRGGRRYGAGRKRVHEHGYKTARDLLWKTISVHTSIFEQWKKEQDRRGFKKPFGLCKISFGFCQKQGQRFCKYDNFLRRFQFTAKVCSKKLLQSFRGFLFDLETIQESWFLVY